MVTLRRSPMSSFLSALALGTIVLTSLLPALAFGAPLVAITRPTQGATVSGQIWIDVAFSSDSNLPITRLEVYIDDKLAREHDLAQPMLMGRQTFNWDFSYAASSVHKIGARAIDAGNNTASASITVQVQSAAVTGPDVIPPQIRIYYPAQGARLSGTTEVKAEANDNVGVELVYFYIDGRLHKMMMNAPPYVDAWDTTRDVDGPHVLEAVAVDRAENEARSAQVTVIVENHSMTTMGAAPGAGAMGPTGLTPSPLPTTPTPQPLTTTVPTPAPLTPAPAPALTTPTAPGPSVAPTSPTSPATSAASTPPEPKLFTIIPRVGTPVVPAAPSAPRFPWEGAQSPVAVDAGRQTGPAAVGGPKSSTSQPPARLDRPATSGTGQPAVSGGVTSAPKAIGPAGGATGATPPTVQAASPSAPASTQPGPVAILGTQPTATVPSLHGPAAPTKLVPIAPLLEINAPRLATTGMRPAVAKSLAPVGQLLYSIAGRTSVPGSATVARTDVATPVAPTRAISPAPAPLPRPLPTNTARVVPVGPPVAAAYSPPVTLEAAMTVTPERKLAPGAGLVRVTAPTLVATKPTATVPPTPRPAAAPPKAATLTPTPVKPSRPAGPAQVASVTKPPITPALLTDAALAEYREQRIPASRMLACLPQTGIAGVSADSRTTEPQGDVAAVPVAVVNMRDIKIIFDGEVLSLRATPETKRGIALAPLREIFEQTDGVLYWFPVEKRVQAVSKGVDVKLTIGDPKVTVNGEQRVLAVAPYLKRGRTMVPLQFIADVLDVNIAVNSATGQITISSNQF